MSTGAPQTAFLRPRFCATRAAQVFSTGSFVITSSSMQTTVSHKLMFSWPASISVPAQTAAARLCGTTTRPCSAVLTQALPHSYRRGCRASTKFGGGGGDRRGWEEGSASSQQRPHTHGPRLPPRHSTSKKRATVGHTRWWGEGGAIRSQKKRTTGNLFHAIHTIGIHTPMAIAQHTIKPASKLTARLSQP